MVGEIDDSMFRFPQYISRPSSTYFKASAINIIFQVFVNRNRASPARDLIPSFFMLPGHLPRSPPERGICRPRCCVQPSKSVPTLQPLRATCPRRRDALRLLRLVAAACQLAEGLEQI